MRSWMLAVLVACNIQLVHRSRSFQIQSSNMLLSVSIPHLKSSHLRMDASTLSTRCIYPPYSELAKHLLGDRRTDCNIRHSSFKSSSQSSSWTRFRVGALVNYVRGLRWSPIPLGLGFAFIAYQQLRHIRKRELSKVSSASSPSDLLASDFEVSLYTMLPLRATSRFWGWVNTIDLPKVIRSPLLKTFIYTYGCNVNEAVNEDLNHYHNLGEFFRRSLKPEVRPIHPGNVLVSPADGTVLHYGVVQNGLVEQVKGITYSLCSFLGPLLFKDGNENILSDEQYQDNLITKKGNVLHHCVVYLAPGDYHKFHSPADWKIHHRRHFPGKLLSVCPGVVSWIAGLFNLNERVVYTGEWEHGFFSMTAVGATNVGSIKVYFDETLKTNKKSVKDFCEECCFVHKDCGVSMSKGNSFGEFNLGSTVVLIFEAPKDFQFAVERGQKIKYGELLSYSSQSLSCRAA